MRCLIFVWMLLSSLGLCAREVTDLRSYGDEAPSTMYLFTSPNCPHCRDFHKVIFPSLISHFVDKKKAQLVIVDMPFDKASLHAVMVMRCLPEDKANKMMGWLYEHQSTWMESKDPDHIFQQYAQFLGMYQSEYQACLENVRLKDAIINQRDTLSSLYAIRGWPTIALRQGNTVSFYLGTDKRMILSEMDKAIKKFQEEQKKQAKSRK